MSRLPSDDEVLAFLADNPGQNGKREVARAFGIKGSDRIALKQQLKSLRDRGLLSKEGSSLRPADALPAVFPAHIVSVDDDGEPLIEPNLPFDGSPPRFVLVQKSSKRARTATRPPGIGDMVLVRQTEPPENGAAGAAELIKVIGKPVGRTFGVLRLPSRGPATVEPVDRKADVLTVPVHELGEAKDGDLVAATRLPGRRRNPEARVDEIFGQLGTERAISQIAILRADIPDAFPPQVLAETEALPVAPAEGREDWRTIPLITIDPATAKDHDDAVHAAPDNDEANPGGFVVIVAIADVAAYVQPHTKLDQEARRRGNSVYFPDRVVPMLPERLSTDLCSLRANEDRPALAIRMVFGADGNKKRHSLHRVLIRLHAGLAYEAAQAAIDGAAPPDGITPASAEITEAALKPLWAAYEALTKARNERAPLALDLPERKLVLDEAGAVAGVDVPERLDAHRLIEEFMIQANVAAAQLLEAKKAKGLYRIHDAPSVAKFEGLRAFLKSLNISIAPQSSVRPRDFNRILGKTKGQPNEPLINEMVLRSQAQAEYSPDNIGHFGLNLSRYAHFTSPIRRYADLIVHRALIAAYKLGDGDGSLPDVDVLSRLGDHLSGTERRAMLAERETTDRLIAAYLADQIGAKFYGRITGVVGAGLFVRLAETGADGFVPVAGLGEDYFVFDEANQALAGSATGRTFQLGDDVEVKLEEALPLAGALRFAMLSKGKTGKPAARRGRSGHSKPGRKGGKSVAAHVRRQVRKARGR